MLLFEFQKEGVSTPKPPLGAPLLLPHPQGKQQNTTQHLKHFTSIPYVHGVSERIGRILNEAGVKVVMKLVKTIGSILTSLENPIAEHEKSRLVFKIPCADCEFVYVGPTKRDLKSCVAEHKRAVKNAEPEKSALYKHLLLFDHHINWEESAVLKYVNGYRRRLIAESWFINAHTNVINHSDGETLPSVYRSLAQNAQ